MLWSFIAAAASSEVTPVDSAVSSITGYILSYGVLGIAALAMGWLWFKGWRLVSPKAEEAAKAAEAAARTAARADLIAERDRLLADKREIERERDEALRVARDQLIPLLVNFTSATQSLLPLLQALIRQAGGGGP